MSRLSSGTVYIHCFVLGFVCVCVYWGFPGGSAGIESTCNVGDLGLIPGLGRSPGEGKGYPLQYSGLENSMDCTVRGIAKSQTQLSHFHFHMVHTLFFFLFFFAFLWYLLKAVGIFSTIMYISRNQIAPSQFCCYYVYYTCVCLCLF